MSLIFPQFQINDQTAILLFILYAISQQFIYSCGIH